VKKFKVISPIERRDGTKWWMKCGSGFPNKDDSINIYLDALPLAALAAGKGVTLQLREYTEEELRERSERSAQYQRGPSGMPLPGGAPGAAGSRPSASDAVPF